MGVLKKDASPEIVAAIASIEARSDECYRPLQLLHVPRNVALWGLMVGAIQVVEREIQEWSDDSPYLSAALRNLSAFVPIAMKWAIEHGQPSSASADLTWSTPLEATVKEAVDVASGYSHFVTCFPMWHRDRYSAQLLSPDIVRFTAPGAIRDRQVSAYLKGFRPKAGPFEAVPAKRPKTPVVIEALFALSLQGALMTGFNTFRYRDPWTLWRELIPDYQSRVDAIARRKDTLLLGSYTLAEFKHFYAAFLAICAAHEFLCYAWGRQSGRYPLGSGVMVRSRSAWAELVSELSAVPPEKCHQIISDLTIDFARSLVFTSIRSFLWDWPNAWR